MLNKFIRGKEDYFYFFFRVLVGLLFMQHGAQKLFGALGGNAAPFFTMFWFAGIVEFFGGLLVVLGLFTRLGALLALSEMLVAYFKVHIPQGFFPIMNQGELALMYFVAFLIIFVYGARKWSFSKLIFKKEIL